LASRDSRSIGNWSVRGGPGQPPVACSRSCPSCSRCSSVISGSSSVSATCRTSITASWSPWTACPTGTGEAHSMASSFYFTSIKVKPATSSLDSANGPSTTVRLPALYTPRQPAAPLEWSPSRGEQHTRLGQLLVVPEHRLDELRALGSRPRAGRPCRTSMNRIVLASFRSGFVVAAPRTTLVRPNPRLYRCVAQATTVSTSRPKDPARHRRIRCHRVLLPRWFGPARSRQRPSELALEPREEES
jgi:hypothetical protein